MFALVSDFVISSWWIWNFLLPTNTIIEFCVWQFLFRRKKVLFFFRSAWKSFFFVSVTNSLRFDLVIVIEHRSNSDEKSSFRIFMKSFSKKLMQPIFKVSFAVISWWMCFFFSLSSFDDDYNWLLVLSSEVSCGKISRNFLKKKTNAAECDLFWSFFKFWHIFVFSFIVADQKR